MSKLTKKQEQEHIRIIDNKKIMVKIRYDDSCDNGHNTFSITGTLYEKNKYNEFVESAGGCIHDEIIKFYPEFKHLIKWHLCNSESPLHYLSNTLYSASNEDWDGKYKNSNIKHARKSAIWPSATLQQLQNKAELLARLPKLMEKFRKDIEALGFVY